MAKTEVIRARIEPELKKDIEIILKELGLTLSDAINIYLRQIKITNGIPFELKVPNRKTIEAINEFKDNKGVTHTDPMAYLQNMRDKFNSKK